MQSSLRSTTVLIGVLAMAFVALPLEAGAASTKPESPVAAPADTITVADVKTLREAIKSLHDRFEDQGKILLKNSDDLGTLTKRVDDFLLPSTLRPVEDGLAAIVKRLSDLNSAQGRLAEAQEKQGAETAAQLREATLALTRLQEELAKSNQGNQAAVESSMAQLRKDLAASRSPATARAPAESPIPLFVAIGGAALILGVLILLSAQAQRRAQRSAQEQMGAALAQTRDVLFAEIQQRLPAAAAGNTDGLAEIRAKLQNVLERLNPAPASVDPDDHTTKKFSDPPADERTTVRNPVVPGAGIPSASCWPAAFLDPASPLAAWRERIEAHLASKEHPALPVFSALLALRTLCVRQPAPTMTEVGTAVISLSQTLYAYWETLPDLSDDDRARANSDWIRAVKAMIAPVAAKLEIREIIAGARFDSDSMQTVHEGTGNHLNVAAVYSWATLDRSGERVKVLQRARIATN